jgi:putative N6-adenine-specific DNA methylase
MINPPYGERIEVSGKAARASSQDRHENRETPDDFFPPDFFQRLAAHWKRAYTQHAAGWTAYVLSPDMKLASSMRLKESRRVPMWNGPIECRLYRFDLVSGSMRGGPTKGESPPP